MSETVLQEYKNLISKRNDFTRADLYGLGGAHMYNKILGALLEANSGDEFQDIIKSVENEIMSFKAELIDRQEETPVHHDIIESYCPHCKEKFNRVCGNSGETPKGGEFTMCRYCLNLLVFNDDLTTRVFTDNDEISQTVLNGIQEFMKGL